MQLSCGSGINACHDALAMRVAGLPDPLLYPGSYSDWSRAGLPVETGDEPGRYRVKSWRFLSRIRGGEGAHMAAAAPGTPGTPSHRLLDCQVESPGRWSAIAGTALAALLPPRAGRVHRLGSE